MLFNIKNLHVSIGGKEILKGFNLGVNAGEVHAIMGPNGTGKSTLAAAITGREGYEITEGEIWYKGKNIVGLPAEERANMGIFLSFQYPVEIPGVSIQNFMRTALNSKREYQGLAPMSVLEFNKLIKQKQAMVEITEKLQNRYVNVGYSGGEKKKNEIFQMAMLEPQLAILDETDSGLDIDALRIVANGVNQLHNEDNAFIVITHYQRLLDYIVPDFVHVMYDGRIVKSGDKKLALELEDKGYEWVKDLAI
ncbi:MAG: Fe-S cluster assembly ATPase SufC [Bacteroidales bacterium]|nr:Fe-S cluster assembly ATPase SufC [Bacteroidales bacterium]